MLPPEVDTPTLFLAPTHPQSTTRFYVSEPEWEGQLGHDADPPIIIVQQARGPKNRARGGFPALNPEAARLKSPLSAYM